MTARVASRVQRLERGSAPPCSCGHPHVWFAGKDGARAPEPCVRCGRPLLSFVREEKPAGRTP